MLAIGCRGERPGPFRRNRRVHSRCSERISRWSAHAEIEPFPCRVLEHRFPGVPNLGDVAKITAEDLEALGQIDLVSSVARARTGA